MPVIISTGTILQKNRKASARKCFEESMRHCLHRLRQNHPGNVTWAYCYDDLSWSFLGVICEALNHSYVNSQRTEFEKCDFRVPYNINDW